MIRLRVILLTLLAAALVALAFADAGAPAACRHADQLAGQGKLAAARTEYVAALDDTATAACAGAGLGKVDTKQCLRAAGLAAQDQVDAAIKLAAAVAAEDPPGTPTPTRGSPTPTPSASGPPTADCSTLAAADSCASAQALEQAHLLADAFKYYVSLLHGPTAQLCATAGIANVAQAECAAAAKVRMTDQPKAYAAIAAQAVSDATSCS